MIPGNSLQKGTMKQFRKLFQKYEDTKQMVTEDKANWKKSLFVGPVSSIDNIGILDIDVFDKEHVFVIIHTGEDNWSLLHISNQTISYFDPYCDSNADQPNQGTAQLRTTIFSELEKAAQKFNRLFDPSKWTFNACIPNYISTYEPPQLEDRDAAIYVLFAMDMLYHDVPINIDKDVTPILRKTYSRYILNTRLPL